MPLIDELIMVIALYRAMSPIGFDFGTSHFVSNRIVGVWLVCSPRVWQIRGSSSGRVKPKLIELVYVHLYILLNQAN